MSEYEKPFLIKSKNGDLCGILNIPPNSLKRGVLIVVGGPQTRVGSHRQFVLLARYLSDNNIPVMRFDYHGMGDSEGSCINFEGLDSVINLTINEFYKMVPSLTEVVIWGLCDASSAALMYGYKDKRVTGLVLLNPWVRTEASMAKTYLRHYYISRIMEKELWTKLLSGKLNFKEAFRSFANLVSLSRKNNMDSGAETRIANKNSEENIAQTTTSSFYIDKMRYGLGKFEGRILFILSGDDLTAAEFKDLISESNEWQNLMDKNNIVRKELKESNHTFSRKEWRNTVARWTKDWITSW